jgi:hypothetical protein
MSSLHALVRRAVVRISAPGEGYETGSTVYWGSGFFVAPGWVLTCAHVVAMGGGAVWGGERCVGVAWEGGSATGEVVLALPRPDDPGRPPRTWPLPDLALVRVADAGDHACVWLSDTSAAGPEDISLHGWSDQTGDLAYRWVIGATSGRDGRHGSALLLRGEQPVEGCSGGPVVDLRRGSVIGLCKARIADDPTAGLAVPVTALRALCDLPGGGVLHEVLQSHDRYHLHRHRAAGAEDGWTDVQSELRPDRHGGFGPVLRTNLYGRLAELTPPATPGEVTVLVDAVKRRVFRETHRPGIDHDPRSWRDGAGLLQDSGDRGRPGRNSGGDAELEAVLLYAAEVWGTVTRLGRARDREPLAELRTWVQHAAEPLPRVVRQEIEDVLDAQTLPGTGGGPRADVLVEIDRSPYGDRYPWRVKLLYDGCLVTPVHGDERGVPRARLHEALREPIADALRRGDVGPHLAAVEVALPPELFDEPLDTWRLVPRRPPGGWTDPDGLPLGARRVVVVRDRRRVGTGNPEWRRRWSGVRRGPLTAVQLRDGHESWNAAYDRLSRAPLSSVPVFCGRVTEGAGATAMDAALTAGHPVVLWRTCTSAHDGCGEDGRENCAAFHREAGRLVAAAGQADGLHDPVRSLRIRAADPDPEGTGAAWARSIALLYDPPDRPGAQGGPLYEPDAVPGVTS